MATWDVATEGEPIFASKNYINQDAIDYGTFTANEMQALISRIVDGDPASYWQGSVATDGTSVVITLSLNEGSAIVARTIDLIVLQNINWKNFIGEYSTDGAAYSTITGLNFQSGVANNSETDKVVNVTAGFSAKYLRFTITHTITDNEKKKCGGIIACAGVVQNTGGFADLEVKYREAVREVELGDRTLSREYIMRSAASYDFWGASIRLLHVTAAELLLLRQIKRDAAPFIFIPEPGDNKREAYLCHFEGPWTQQYENPVRSIGYSLKIKVKEVGSH